MAEAYNEEVVALLQKELTTYRSKQITTVLTLLNEGNTVPFIARYRKEMTGSLDEVQIREIEERYHYLQNLKKRKEEVLRLIEEQGKLTKELKTDIQKAVKCNKWKICIDHINKTSDQSDYRERKRVGTISRLVALFT